MNPHEGRGPGESAVGRTVLLVEDNPVNMKLARDLLGLLGCRVLEAPDAETGLALLKGEKADLVLLDIQLPGMDGLAACRVIREEMGFREIPIIALTALAMAGDEKKAFSAGFTDYITKPFRVKEFLERVASYLTNAKSIPLMEGGKGAGASTVPERRRKKVLVVDDNPVNTKLIQGMLPADIYEVLRAHSGREGLALAEKEIPDVVFLDIMMPDLDGYEVAKRLKAGPETGDIPIVMVTALDQPEDRVRGLEAGAEDVLVKPVNLIEVRARARSMVRLGEYQRQLALRHQAAHSLAGEAPPGAASRPAGILLVEDNPVDLELLKGFLAQEGYSLWTAVDGEEALRRLGEGGVDLVLFDILMPGMDGFELLRRIKDSPEGKRIQAVAVTSLTDLEEKLKGLELGADDYLIKPVNPRELITRVRVLLRKKAYLDELHEGYRAALTSATLDGLTGLFNRAYFTRFLELELGRVRRHRYPVSLALLDIDEFKSYNTRFGHLAGDLVLRETALILKENVRDIDLVCRFGGDEFAVVLPYCGERDAELIMGRIQGAMARHRFPEDAGFAIGSVRLSGGSATSTEGMEQVEELVAAADSRLFQDKVETRASAPGREPERGG